MSAWPVGLHATRVSSLQNEKLPRVPAPSASLAQDEDGEEEMDDELQDETEEEFDGDQTEPEY